MSKVRWEPIETAPRDGTPIWLRFRPRGNRAHIGWWNGDASFWRWAFVDTNLRMNAFADGDATEWAPLPEPPNDEVSE